MRRARTWAPLWAGLLALAAAPAAVRGADPQIENLRVGFTSNARSNLFKVGTWTPLWVQIKGGTERFTGTMEVEVPDDNGTPTFFRQPVDVAPGELARVVSYARPGSRDPNFLVRLYDERGRQKGQAVDGSRLTQLGPLLPEEMLLLTLGKPQGVEQIPGLPGFSADTKTNENPNPNETGAELNVARFDSFGGLPARWYGYDAAEAVVLDTNDKEVMDVAGPPRARRWSTGSRGAGTWSSRSAATGRRFTTASSARSSPASPTGQEQVNSLDLDPDTFAGATTSRSRPPARRAVMVTKLEEIESRGGKVLSSTGEHPAGRSRARTGSAG